MKPSINIEKRVKRHLLGKAGSFYVSTLPGMEYLCLEELKSIGISTTNAAISKGGVEFFGRIHECYLANLHLRTANRILMRIERFPATNFRHLEKKLAAIAWELYLHERAEYKINVTCRHSRLFHSDAVTDRVGESIKIRQRLVHSSAGTDAGTDIGTDVAGDVEKKPALSRFPQQIFVRAENDRFTLSIDSSGDILHKRGLKVQGGQAPIRETTAAAILSLAGYHVDEPLIDPMCGSGTFSLEGAMIANRIPAGWYRNFAFMGWPCFKPSRWNHIRKEAKSRITPVTRPVIFASDKNTHTCEALKAVIDQHDLSGTISVCVKDFFDLSPADIPATTKGLTHPSRKGLLTLNPPYGRRMETKNAGGKLFAEVCKKLKKDFKGWKIALIAAAPCLLKEIPFKVNAHPLFHGGLHLTLVTGSIPESAD